MATDGNGVVSIDVIKSVETVTAHYQQVETNLRHVLAACDPDVLAELSPLDRAYTFLTLAKAVATLYTLQLQCSGESPEDHPFKKELERLELYTGKVEYYIDMTKARPTTKLNARAATRFIEHSLPDLTPEQRSGMRNISRGEGPGSNSEDYCGKKKRKHELSGNLSVAAAAAEFLAEATKELFGGCNLGKQVEDEESDEDEIVQD